MMLGNYGTNNYYCAASFIAMTYEVTYANDKQFSTSCNVAYNNITAFYQ